MKLQLESTQDANKDYKKMMALNPDGKHHQSHSTAALEEEENGHYMTPMPGSNTTRSKLKQEVKESLLQGIKDKLKEKEQEEIIHSDKETESTPEIFGTWNTYHGYSLEEEEERAKLRAEAKKQLRQGRKVREESSCS